MAKIKQLLERGQKIYPLTSSEAVVTKDNIVLTEKLEDMESSSVKAQIIGELYPEVDPGEYATMEEISQLQQEIHNLSGKYYGIYESVNNLPEGDVIGYAFVGAQAPFAIYNFNGTSWVNSGASAQAIYGEPGADGIGFQTITSLQDGTIIITLTNGDTITIDLNHNHPQYLKYQELADEAAYEALTTKESDTLYLIPE